MEESKNALAIIGQLVGVEITKELISSPEFAEMYEVLANTLAYCENLKKTVDAGIKAKAEENYMATGEQSIVSSGYRYTYIPETVRETLNTKAFKADHPDMYKEYVKVSSVSPTLRVTKIEKKGESDA